MEEYTPILRRGYSLPGCLNPQLACSYSWYSPYGSMDSCQDVANTYIWWDHLYYNGWNGYLDPCIDL